jgi:protein-disulfide isomerase
VNERHRDAVRRSARVIAAVLVVLGTLSCGATLRAEGITEKQAEEILKELRQIRQLLERSPPGSTQPVRAPAPPERVKVTLGTGYAIGRVDAPLTMVEFTDYQCPYCRRFHQETFEQLKKNWIDTGKLRYVGRDLPLDFHTHARGAAIAARCAGEQGRFWDMRNQLFSNQNRLAQSDLTEHAHTLGLDEQSFNACLQSGRFAQEIDRDLADAKAIGIEGTPSFILGRFSGDAVEGLKLVGAQPYSIFQAELNKQLEASSQVVAK